MKRLDAQPDDLLVLQNAVAAVELGCMLPFYVDFWKAQNIYYELMQKLSAPPAEQKNAQHADEREQARQEQEKNQQQPGENKPDEQEPNEQKKDEQEKSARQRELFIKLGELLKILPQQSPRDRKSTRLNSSHT